MGLNILDGINTLRGKKKMEPNRNGATVNTLYFTSITSAIVGFIWGVLTIIIVFLEVFTNQSGIWAIFDHFNGKDIDGKWTHPPDYITNFGALSWVLAILVMIYAFIRIFSVSEHYMFREAFHGDVQIFGHHKMTAPKDKAHETIILFDNYTSWFLVGLSLLTDISGWMVWLHPTDFWSFIEAFIISTILAFFLNYVYITGVIRVPHMYIEFRRQYKHEQASTQVLGINLAGLIADHAASKAGKNGRPGGPPPDAVTGQFTEA